MMVCQLEIIELNFLFIISNQSLFCNQKSDAVFFDYIQFFRDRTSSKIEENVIEIARIFDESSFLKYTRIFLLVLEPEQA